MKIKGHNALLIPIVAVLSVIYLAGCGSYETAVQHVQQAKYINLPIMGHGKANADELAKYFMSKNKNINKEFLIKFAQAYINEANAEGVNSDVAFIQMCLETNYLRFGGQVKAKQYNFAGIGALDNGVQGASFKNIQTGIRAQIQHLKAYASSAPLNNKVVDPRFTYVKRNSVKYVSQLGNGNWATDPLYAKKLMHKLHQLYQLNNIA